jgi:hypothetical protein
MVGVAAAILAVGFVTVMLARRRRTVPMLAVLLVAGVIGFRAAPADAASDCPTTTLQPTTTSTAAPTTTQEPSSSSVTTVAVVPSTPTTPSTITTPTSTTSTTTSTTTSSTTTTTLALRAPAPGNDSYSAAIGSSVSGNVLTNDDLGNPPGAITLVVWPGGSALPGIPAIQPLGILTLQLDGSFVFQNTGIPAGSWIFYNYRVTNSVGTSAGILQFSGA